MQAKIEIVGGVVYRETFPDDELSLETGSIGLLQRLVLR
jgi:hypothetical protein